MRDQVILKRDKVIKGKVKILKPLVYFSVPESPLKTTEEVKAPSTSEPQASEPKPVIPKVIEPSIDYEKINQETEELKAQRQEDITRELEAYKAEEMSKIESQLEAERERGYNEGVEKAKQESEKKLTQLSDQLLDTINDVVKEKNRVLKDAELDIISLSRYMAELIIHKNLTEDESAYHAILEEAFMKLTEKEWVKVKVNPENLDEVERFQDAFEKKLRDIKKIEIVGDANIESGGVVLETKLGFVDSSVSTKLELIESTLKKTYYQDIKEKEEVQPIIDHVEPAPIMDVIEEPLADAPPIKEQPIPIDSEQTEDETFSVDEPIESFETSEILGEGTTGESASFEEISETPDISEDNEYASEFNLDGKEPPHPNFPNFEQLEEEEEDSLELSDDDFELT